jgi:hypothetical protein
MYQLDLPLGKILPMKLSISSSDLKFSEGTSALSLKRLVCLEWRRLYGDACNDFLNERAIYFRNYAVARSNCQLGAVALLRTQSNCRLVTGDKEWVRAKRWTESRTDKGPRDFRPQERQTAQNSPWANKKISAKELKSKQTEPQQIYGVFAQFMVQDKTLKYSKDEDKQLIFNR